MNAGSSAVYVAHNRFSDSGCGVNGAYGTFEGNVFESTLSSNAARFLYPEQVKFYDNYVAKSIYAGGTAPTREQLDMRGNALLKGVDDQPAGQDPSDLADNWWGHVLDDPITGCYDRNATYIPAVTYTIVDGNSCYAQAKQTITGYFTKVLPALTEAPPVPAAGVNGTRTFSGSVSDGQLYGPGGASEFAAAPAGSMADPVNTATGALTHAETDLGMASRTGNLSVNLSRLGWGAPWQGVEPRVRHPPDHQ